MRSFAAQLKEDALASKFRIKISTPSLNRPGRTEGVTPTTTLQKIRGAYELPATPAATVAFAIGKESRVGDRSDVVEDDSAERLRWVAPLPAVGAMDGPTACKMDVPAVLPDQVRKRSDFSPRQPIVCQDRLGTKNEES